MRAAAVLLTMFALMLAGKHYLLTREAKPANRSLTNACDRVTLQSK